ncbi:peptide deformylase [Candidatus Falkowbacteria bacterium RIFOXYD2_FULL_35_9]|uniref:Peptide deformylase n=1 Tax=Candidatus Falkowbacteria bacterium RIFOXYC2_FULL_36_12 TaxID=1798002 RepID=A0A1F5T0F4_9BACT|nr:MAG: peptide deformylase [Candidatus Falkowbacteria bacterium RIFOXYB2_FULL_35_7]OGF32430.1 MAG: peptide deformylase [Candidatus Falkowbacteria bacterium RIFOXYC2_FULL_36_12]OGF46779.1 MAG: peptide deformylase [Candidatus Falkowbacteria bacterium RIFOXYD2_FULL_35_9]
MLLEIIKLPNKNLRLKAREVQPKELQSEDMQKFIIDLIQTMREKDGIGLASTQVDKQLQIFVIATEDGAKVFVNPKIISKSWLKVEDEEGCLSVPEVFGIVKRSKRLLIKALDRNGDSFTLRAKGLLARVIQHENDHLNGVLFIDKVKKITSGEEILANLYKLQKSN